MRPDLAEVHDNRGNVLRDLRRYADAVASHDRAIALRPNDAGAFSNRGNALRDLHRYDEALASYDRAILLQPGFLEARCNRALVLQVLRRYDEALTGFDQVVAVASDYAEAFNGRGNVLRDLGRYEEAVASFARAIALKDDYAEAHNNLGNALQDLHQFDEALSSHAHAIALRPDFAAAHNSHGNALQAVQRSEEALASFARAIALKPDYAEARYNAGNALAALQRMTGALAEYYCAIALRSDYADAYRGRGLGLYALKRYEEALASYQRALVLAPGMDWLPGDILAAKRQVCDWTSDGSAVAALEERVRLGQQAVAPFTLTFTADSPALQRKAAEIFVRRQYPANDSLPLQSTYSEHTKIRIGYFSADFRDHAMMHVMIDLFACHDRSRFTLTAFSFGPDTEDDWRGRAIATFDRFIDVRAMSDREVMLLARSLEIDIAVDLMGFTMGGRTGIFGYRAAPVQVAYLGYPGTMGADYIDYILADRILIPPGDEMHYSEKTVRLPGTYQVNDRRRPVSERRFTREELGLPESGFVFCCFNNNYKITPRVFDLWMRILRGVGGSVLWLYAENPGAAANLRMEAEARDIAPERLVFARKLPLADHLARHQLAGLFLDTLPYNGHATASLALWAGLPVLTQIGTTFAGRVAASLLTAIDLPELVTTTPEAYEALAVELALRPDRLLAVKAKLEQNCLTAPLFDTERFTRSLEAAYVAMHARVRAGLGPAAIDVGTGAHALHDAAAVRRKNAEGPDA